MKRVLLSAINIHTSGPLTIVRDALAAICRTEAFRFRTEIFDAPDIQFLAETPLDTCCLVRTLVS